jgi:CheY-like chemotaxis protein
VNQQLVRKQLTRAGCIVHVANHGQEALKLLEELGEGVDVILMDTQMPVMDGLECTREIRRLEREKRGVDRKPIIAVTANARREQVEEALRNGAVSSPFFLSLPKRLANRSVLMMRQDAVMQKPFKTSDLVNAIRENIEKCAQTNEARKAGAEDMRLRT